jgi:hypothetical protein
MGGTGAESVEHEGEVASPDVRRDSGGGLDGTGVSPDDEGHVFEGDVRPQDSDHRHPPDYLHRYEDLCDELGV